MQVKPICIDFMNFTNETMAFNSFFYFSQCGISELHTYKTFFPK